MHTQILGDNDGFFYTSCGVKQGCPFSCLLFISYFQVFLDKLPTDTPFTAYVDDVTLLTSKESSGRLVHDAATILRQLGMQLNLKKTEVLPLRCTKHELPQDILQSSLTITPSTMHLGHPISGIHHTVSPFQNTMHELTMQIKTLDNHPLPTHHRIQLANTILIPSLLHRTELQPLTKQQLQTIRLKLTAYIFNVHGFPPILSPKIQAIWPRPTLLSPKTSHESP